jgi:DNA-binding NtrC family response regulator
LVARAVHEASTRSAAPLVVVDCASLPEALFENELFGHERGAFTGATANRAGLVESASGGTLFLDEVGDIPLAIQVKLLRLLESGTYRRVGSTELRHADIRVVAATHRDLAAMVVAGRFREDLFFRLSVFPIRLPALRERAGDVRLLAVALLARVAPQRRLTLAADALARLEAQAFPGNVRELRNLLERSALLCDGSVIEIGHVEAALAAGAALVVGVAAGLPAGMALGQRGSAGLPQAASPENAGTAQDSLRRIARDALVAQVRAHRGSRAALARQLGISERSLYRKLRELGDERGD